MADIAPDHLFLRQRLLPVLLRTVAVVVVNHGTATVMPELCRRHRRSLQVAARIFDAPLGPTGVLREVHLPAATVLRLRIPLPLLFIADMSQPRKAAGGYQIITVAQQADDSAAPDAVFHIESAAGDAEVNMWMRVKLSAVRMQSAEDTNLHALFAGSRNRALSRGQLSLKKS